MKKTIMSIIGALVCLVFFCTAYAEESTVFSIVRQHLLANEGDTSTLSRDRISAMIEDLAQNGYPVSESEYQDEESTYEVTLDILQSILGSYYNWSIEEKHAFDQLMVECGELSYCFNLLPGDGEISQEDALRIALSEISSRFNLDQSMLDNSAVYVSYYIADHSVCGGMWRFGVELQNQMSFGVVVTDGSVTQCEKYVAIDDLEEDDVLLTASLVGAPNAANQYMTPKDIAKTVEILQKNCDFHIGGIITNEQGGEATVNGWLQAAVTGLPVVDAPCNGRAHPTGVMGSMNLHKIPDYTTVQACVGGNPDTGNHIECFFEGNIDHTSKMVRLASIEAGGLVAVARNPVKVSYARQNCAIGGVSFAIETGKAFLKGLETSVEEGVNSLCTFLNGRILARGPVQNFSIETTGGFDVGYATVDGCDMTFWNEYATVEKDGERLATFPDLIMTINAKTGEPVTTAMMEESLDVYVITTDKKNLKLSPTMYAPELLKATEDVIKKDLISYLDK